jgi:hypothetical protein
MIYSDGLISLLENMKLSKTLKEIIFDNNIFHHKDAFKSIGIILYNNNNL